MKPLLSLKRVSVFAEGLDHPECVAVHPDGSVWAGGEAGQIYRIPPAGGAPEVVASTGGFILGIAFSPDTRWLAACDIAKKCVWRLDLANRRLTELARGFGIPNYITFDATGSFYLSDSGGFREVSGQIYRFDAGGKGGVWHRGPFNFANGLALSPGGDALFVACTWLPGVERVEIRPDGSAGKRAVFVRLPKTLPDGLAFDRRGNLYVSCYTPARIYRISPQRKVRILVDDWEAHTLSNPTNIAFGGAGRSRLFAANLGRWHIARVDLGVAGAPLACHVRSRR